MLSLNALLLSLGNAGIHQNSESTNTTIDVLDAPAKSGSVAAFGGLSKTPTSTTSTSAGSSNKATVEVVASRSLSIGSKGNNNHQTEFEKDGAANGGNDNDNSHDHFSRRRRRRRRPYLILHVGPPKTGTTTIQKGLAAAARMLAEKDNYYFIGQRGGRTEDVTIFDDGKRNDSSVVKMFPVKQFWPGTPAKPRFRNEIRRHLASNHNVIISSEQYTSAMRRDSKPELWTTLYEEIFLLPRKKNATETATATATGDVVAGIVDDEHEDETETPFFGFNVKIVVAYRHFFEWAPSIYYQAHLGYRGHVPKLKATTDGGNEKRVFSLYRDPRTNNTVVPVYPSGRKSLYPTPSYVPGFVEWMDDFLLHYEKNKIAADSSNANDATTTNGGPSNKIIDSYNFNKEENGGRAVRSHASVWSHLMWSSLKNKETMFGRVHVFDMHQQEVGTIANNNDSSNNGSGVNTNATTTAKQQQRRDLFADFVCQMIPAATSTCRNLTAEFETGDKKELVLRTRFSKMKNGELGFVSTQDQIRIIQAGSIFNPTFAEEAADAKFLNRNKLMKRIDQWFVTRRRQDNVTTESLERAYKRCLSAESQSKLKSISWQYLSTLLSLVRNQSRRRPTEMTRSLFRSSTPTDHLILSSSSSAAQQKEDRSSLDHYQYSYSDLEEESWKIPVKKEHDKLFDEYRMLPSSPFCEIDIPKLFQGYTNSLLSGNKAGGGDGSDGFIRYVFSTREHPTPNFSNSQSESTNGSR